MNTKDKSDIVLMMDFLKQEIPIIRQELSKIDRDVGLMYRAIYGDQINKTKGLIDYNKSTQHDINKLQISMENKLSTLKLEVDENIEVVNQKVDKLEKLRRKVVWIVTGFGLGTGITGAGIWEVLSKMK